MSKHRFIAFIVLFLVTLLVAPLPAGAQEDAPLAVKGEHAIQVFRSTAESDTRVIENLFLENTGESPFDGDLWLDLHPAITEMRHYWHNESGGPLSGEAGQPSDAPLTTEDAGEHTRHIMNLNERGVSIAPGQTLLLVLDYRLPSEESEFTRGFTLDTPALKPLIVDIPGLFPRSDATPLEPVRHPQSGTWTYQFVSAEDAAFSAGDRFAFTWVPQEEPLEPLRVQIQTQGEDPVELTATASGGIPEYEYAWDLDGDGTCDDADGQTAQLPREEEVQDVTACVTDSAVPPGEARQSFQARTVVVDGTFDGPSPWLLLVIGLLGGGFLVFALTQGGFVPTGGRRTQTTRPAYGAESREMLEMRQRVMIASLKELEIAKKKGEVDDSQYTKLKSELKKGTVEVMRELERRKTEKETV